LFINARGVLRGRGGINKPIYNIIYGPPIFAPLLFAGKHARQRETQMSDSSKIEVETRPVDAAGNPIGPLPGFSTLSQQEFWDAKTRQVVLDRVNRVPEIRFFDPQQARLMKAIWDRVLSQDDRDDAQDSAMHEYGHGFADIGPREQDEILRSLHRGKPSAGHDISECPGFENGLANSSDTVGRYLIAQACNVVIGRFEKLVRMHKAPPAHALTEEFYETDPKRDFAPGFAIQTVGPLPIAFAKQMMTAKGAWGWDRREVMMDYNHWAAFGFPGKILPHAENRVQLADEKDQNGIPITKMTFNLGDNDKKLIDFGKNQNDGSHVGSGRSGTTELRII
jgi:hypothetical protein